MLLYSAQDLPTLLPLENESGRRFRLHAIATLGNNGTAPPTIQTLAQAKWAVARSKLRPGRRTWRHERCASSVMAHEEAQYCTTLLIDVKAMLEAEREAPSESFTSLLSEDSF
jgi:hypothetical protein